MMGDDSRTVRFDINNIALWAVVCGVGITLTGCVMQAYIQPEPLPMDQLSVGYQETPLKDSSSLEVLHAMQSQDASLDVTQIDTSVITQSDKVIASSGRSKDGYKHWFTMFVFDPQDMSTQRKYFFYMDERTKITPVGPRRYLFPPRQTLVFRCEAVLMGVLSRPYTTNEARYIAVIREMASIMCQDLKTLDERTQGSRGSSDVLSTSGMFMNQVYRDALLQLERYPAMTKYLDQEKGVEFDHINLDAGRIHLKLNGDIAIIEMQVGIPLRESPPLFANSK